jgi:hypothetical protein
MDHQAFAEMLGNYGEFVGAIAVVVTLGYLAVQLRRNSEVSKYQFLFQIQSEWNRLGELTIGSNEMLKLLNLCRSSSLPEELAPEDQERLRFYANSIINTYAAVVMAKNNRQIDDQMYEAFRQDLYQSLDRWPALKPILQQVLHVEEFRRDPLFDALFDR